MKLWMTVMMTALVAWLGALLAADEKGQPAVQLKTKKDRASYSLGVNIGKRFRSLGDSIDADLVARGIRDAIAGKQQLNDDECREALTGLQEEMAAKENEQGKVMAEKNRRDGEAYLEANKKKEGVVALPSGLQYKVLTAGAGKSPKATDTVTVHYRGTLIDGTEFDSSIKRGEPARFPLNRVIKGWTEVVQLMKVGDKWQVVIPPELAYGARGAGNVIGPNATLIFEIELLGIGE